MIEEFPELELPLMLHNYILLIFFLQTLLS